MTAAQFIKELKSHQSDEERIKVERFYKGPREKNKCLGVRMGVVFQIAKSYIDLPLDQIEKLLESRFHEARVGGVSVMDFQARRKKTPESRRKELFDLYLRRHDRINNWDLVDRSAPYVVGGYLHDKPRDILYQLAESENIWERRTSIVSTYYFIRLGETDDTFEIAEILVNDDSEFVQKAVGSWVREAGKKNQKRLLAFLNEHASTMPRVTLRYAIEKLDPSKKAKFLALGKAKRG